MRSNNIEILQRHTLTDDALHTGKADAELVLQQFTHAADTAVPQVVDVIGLADPVCKAVQIIDRSKDVIGDDMFWHKVFHMLADGVLQRISGVLLHQFAQKNTADLFLHPDLGRIEIHIMRHVHHAVGEDADFLPVNDEVEHHDTGFVNQPRLFTGQDLTLLGNDLSGGGVGNHAAQLISDDARIKRELLVEFIAADIGQFVAAAVIEKAFQQHFCRLHRGRIARAQLAVNLNQALIAILAGILFDGGEHALVLAVDLLQAFVGHGADGLFGDAAQPSGGIVLVVCAHCTQEPGNGKLAVLVNADVEHVVAVGLILQPGAVVRNHRGGINVQHGLVYITAEINARRADNLGNDNTFRTVDDKGTSLGHDREVAHEDLLFLDLFRLFIAQADAHLQGAGVRGVTGFALLFGVLRCVIHGIVDKAQLQIAGVVRNGVHILENFLQAGVQKPRIRAFLNLQQIRHVHDLRRTGKALAQCFPVENISWHWHTLLIQERTGAL